MPLTQVSSRLIEDTLRYVLGASGTNHYTFTGKGLTGAVNDPTLTLSRGHTYIFENRSGGHPFYIKTSIANGGTNDAYNTGVTNNGGGNGTEIVFTVPHDAPDLLYYQCSSHSSMAGQLKIAGAVADGSITESKLADDAVTADKLANSINSAIAANTAKTSLENNSVTTAKIADSAVTDAKINGMAASTLTGALPAISGASLTGISAGITGFDQWYLTSAIANNGTITSNLSRTSTAGNAAPLGSGMSVASGIWTFPNTGIWQIVFNIRFQIDGSDNVDVVMQVTTDGGSNYSSVTHAVAGLNGSGSREASASSMYFLDVTDVSQVKVRFQITSISGGSNVTGSGIPITNFNFIRIGDT